MTNTSSRPQKGWWSRNASDLPAAGRVRHRRETCPRPSPSSPAPPRAGTGRSSKTQLYNPNKIYSFAWLQTPGTIMLIAGLVAFPFMGIRYSVMADQFGKTFRQMIPSLPGPWPASSPSPR